MSMMCLQFSRLVRSVARRWHFWLCASTRALVSWASCSSDGRYVIREEAPSMAKRRAVAWPMPGSPPVMMAFFADELASGFIVLGATVFGWDFVE